ncbi:NAD(P) transhydrogenase subunit alpha [Plesiocystis pacifica SIR-1]|uniref:NAD(P) transhydrogenase subunit alpha n=1 Tax=Plesiocystis pacifica SIR-1 TaxID=391625 RepID=A6GBN0_9BACT|nr:Re/Si-specific NAD(P)(+) transhydrogenase subunit alpha [Plesiocystis pacifica]EDM76736.1 NAD(P) transhydrogenase subunit alpha [Plesiocystis pacifica SIR-1]
MLGSYGPSEEHTLKVGIPKEVFPGERRVATTPETSKRLQKLGFEVLVESGAGAKADFSDESYVEAGCTIIETAEKLWAEADVIVKVREPMDHPELGKHEAELLTADKLLISFIWPAQNEALVEKLKASGGTVVAMDAIPRISRAQKMDALSSMANIAGYRAVVEAAQHFGSFFTGQFTAAGKVPPARVLVIGAGVAGLAAIGAARGLGAIVRAFDTRPAVKEQVESMGAEYLTLEFEEDGTGAGGYAKVMTEAFMNAERELFEEQAKKVDIIVTTALIPGKPAPFLITEKALQNMREGSVVVDLAAERGGNCPLVTADEVTTKHGVTLIGYTDLPSRMANVASNLYGNNIFHLLDDMGGAEGFKVDEDDEVVRGALILNKGEMRWPPPKIEPSPKAAPKPEAKKDAPSTPAPAPAASKPKKKSSGHHGPPVTEPKWWPIIVGGIALLGVGLSDNPDFLTHFTVFVLACFIGYQVVWNVAPALHTPLMSVTNAISGIIIVGGMLQLGGDIGSPALWLGAAAIFFATINIAGGFLVTQRMLKMFTK